MPRPAAKAYTAPSPQIWAWGKGVIANHILIRTYGQANNIFTSPYFILALRFPLTEGIMMEVRRKLDARREATERHAEESPPAVAAR